MAFYGMAKIEGTKTAEGLRKYLDQGLTIVACEPSCASALNDDLPDLIDDETLAAQLKKQVVMIDKFLEDEIGSRQAYRQHLSPSRVIFLFTDIATKKRFMGHKA